MNDDPSSLFQGTPQSGYLGDSRIEADADITAIDSEQVVDETLETIARSFILFTHGPLFTYAGLDFEHADPVREFAAKTPGCEFAFHDFAAPIFKGIARHSDQEAWDRRLFFVPRRFWPELLYWISSTVTVDRTHQRYHRPEPLGIRIVDRLAVERFKLTISVPTVSITVFGVTGNQYRVGFQSDVSLPNSVAKVVPYTLDDVVVRDAERVFSGHKDPLLSKECAWQPNR